MKQYGMNQATEFTAKQIGVIYRNAKQGNLKVEKWYMNRMYKLADFYGMDSNGSIEFEERFIKNAIRKMFEGRMEEAQEDIDNITEMTFDRFTEKAQAEFDRSLVC